MVDETSYINEFLEEISEILNRLDRQFVALEKKPSDTNCLAEIFRDLHTIKGSCGLLGLNKLESITHCGENLLGKLRDGVLALKPEMVNALLKMMDAIWKTVACLKKNGQEGPADYSNLIDTLARLEISEPPRNDSGSTLLDASMIDEFLEEADEILNLLDQQIVALENNLESQDLISSLLRSFHTLKGSSGYMGFKTLETLTHSMENLLITLQEGKTTAKTEFFDCLLKMMDALRKILTHLKASGKEGEIPIAALVTEMTRLHKEASIAPAANKFITEDNDKNPASVDSKKEEKSEGANIRVSVELLDSLMDLVGEVVLARNQLTRIINEQDDTTIHGTSQDLNRVTTELQETMLKSRMQPIKNVWGKLPRMVRDLSLSCGNKVRLEMEGQESNLDKSLITAIQDPLMNIIRNAITHGIEAAEERQSRGKSAEGVLRLRAFNQSGQIHIEVQDDGRGVDFLAIKNQALAEKHISPTQAEKLNDKDYGKLLFLPGFSMTQNSLVKSTKGNGLAHTRVLIEKIGGAMDIDILPGKGTTLKIKIPLTLAIIPALIISSGENRFAIPQINIKELLHLDEAQGLSSIEEIAGSQFYRLRGNLLPLVRLKQVLKNDPSKDSSDLNIVVLQADDKLFGLVVEKIHNTEEIVVKTLENLLRNMEMISGATIMGDGEVILILDVMGLAKYVLSVASENSSDKLIASASAHNEHEDTQAMLIVRLGNNRRIAIQLADVVRLEDVKRSELESSEEKWVVQYRNEIMPLIDIPKLFNEPGILQNSSANLQVVVHLHEGESLGLGVHSIQDIVQGKLNQERTVQGSPLLGTLITNNSVLDVINVKNIVQNFLKSN
jgi:two-component system, chemotaxis family, sensor kinase CheA